MNPRWVWVLVEIAVIAVGWAVYRGQSSRTKESTFVCRDGLPMKLEVTPLDAHHNQVHMSCRPGRFGPKPATGRT
jgi:hypothetical protein